MQEYKDKLKGMRTYEDKRWFYDRFNIKLDELFKEMKSWMPEGKVKDYLMPEDVYKEKPKDMPEDKPKKKRSK